MTKSIPAVSMGDPNSTSFSKRPVFTRRRFFVFLEELGLFCYIFKAFYSNMRV